jgi:uncharacterized membrane protein
MNHSQFRLHGAIPALYSAIAAALCAIYLFLIPPFQVPDEFQHYYYASAISVGNVVPTPMSDQGGAGGMVPTQDAMLTVIYANVPFHREVKVSEDMTTRAEALRYDGTQLMASYRAAAIYSPIAYFASGAGLAIARGLGATPFQAFYAGRAFNAALCLVCFAAALWIMPFGRVFMSAVLLVPMLLSQVASYSSDAVTFALTALIVALLCRLSQGNRSPALLMLCALSVGLLASVKLPLLVLMIPVILVGWDKARKGEIAVAALLALVPVVIWLLMKPAVALQDAAHLAESRLDPQAQLLFLLHNPLAIPGIARDTLQRNWWLYAAQAMGIFGWVDTPVKATFYLAMCGAGGLAGLAALFDQTMPTARLRWSMLFVALAYSAGVFGALYLYSTGVGDPIVSGVQGRYFLPSLMMLAAVLPTVPRFHAVAHFLVLPVLAVEVWSAFASFAAIGQRFYG